MHVISLMLKLQSSLLIHITKDKRYIDHLSLHYNSLWRIFQQHPIDPRLPCERYTRVVESVAQDGMAVRRPGGYGGVAQAAEYI